MDKVKTIAVVVTNDITYDQRVNKVVGWLAENGFKITFIGRKLSNSKACANTDQISFKRFRCLFNKGILFYAEFNLRLFLFLFFRKYDVVTANDLDTIVGNYFGTLFRKTKRVFDSHEWFTEVPELENRSTVKSIWRNIERIFVPRFDKHYTVNESLAGIFKESLNVHFEVIRNVPVHSDESPPKVPPPPAPSKGGHATLDPNNQQLKIILYQGAVNKGRGLEQLIEAVKLLDGFELWIAGDGDVLEELRMQNEQLGIRFLGKAEPNELKSITEQAWIGVNLLENSSQNYYYSLANKFFDYVQAEVPQICMDFPEYRKLNTAFEVAHLIEDLSPETIISAIKKMEDATYYDHLKNQCKQATEEWSWEKEVVNLEKIYL